MARAPVLTVPREALPSGIDKCLDVASWRLREAASLLSAPAEPILTAAILFTFAIEEFGKAVLLRRAWESGTRGGGDRRLL